MAVSKQTKRCLKKKAVRLLQGAWRTGQSMPLYLPIGRCCSWFVAIPFRQLRGQTLIGPLALAYVGTDGPNLPVDLQQLTAGAVLAELSGQSVMGLVELVQAHG